MAERERDERHLFEVTSGALRRWLGKARDVVMAPWRAYRLMPDPTAVYRLQSAWDAEVQTILTEIGKIGLAAWSEATEVPPVSRHAFVVTYLAQVENLLVRIPDEIADLIFAEITDGVNAGESVDQVAARVDHMLSYTDSERWPNRARTVAITETTRAYGAGTLAAGMEQSRVTGRVLRKRWDCMTADHVVTARGVRWAARRWHQGQIVTAITANGSRVSVTPEHKILTRRGWVEAQHLDLIDEVACITVIDSLRTPEVNNLKPSIGQYIDSLLDTKSFSAHRARRVRVGVYFDSETPITENVDYISANRDLLFGLDSQEAEPFKDFILETTDKHLGVLCRFGVGATGSFSYSSSSVGQHQSFDSSDFDLGRLSRDSDKSCLVQGPRNDAGFVHHPADGRLRGFEHNTDSTDRMSRFVEFSDIVSIQVSPFSGHVYDLTTENHWFAANRVVIHNSSRDEKVRGAHREVDGMMVNIFMPFYVDRFPMMFPGDPTAPPEAVINCRCDLVILNEEGR